MSPAYTHFLLPGPVGLPFLRQADWLTYHGSGFCMAKIWAKRRPCFRRLLFSVVPLLAGCLVSGPAAIWVCGCGCGCVLPVFGGCGWLLANLSAA